MDAYPVLTIMNVWCLVTHLYEQASYFQRLVYLNLPETEENSSFDPDINRYRYHCHCKYSFHFHSELMCAI